MLEADEGESESDSDSDSDDENEVEQALADEDMDTDVPQGSKPRRRGGKRRDEDGTDWGGFGLDADDGLNKQMLSYDIYLKGNVSKATSFFKSAEGQTQRFRMFPYVEKKRRVDEYGETVDVETWLRKGKALEEDTETDEVREAKRLAEEEAKASLFVILDVLVVDTKPPPESPSRATVQVCHDQCRGTARLSVVFRGP